MSDELDFTPSEDQMCEDYKLFAGDGEDRAKAHAEFKRGMERIKAQVRAEALREAAEATRREAPREPHAGATFIAHAEWRDERADTGCAHEACEIDTAGNPTRCADCGDYLDSVPDREPSDAEVQDVLYYALRDAGEGCTTAENLSRKLRTALRLHHARKGN